MEARMRLYRQDIGLDDTPDSEDDIEDDPDDGIDDSADDAPDPEDAPINETSEYGSLALKKYAGINFRPPQAVRAEARRGLAWRREHGRGGTAVGVARARDLSNGKAISPNTIGRMVSYFARHEVDKQGKGWSPGQDGYPSTGRIAWALWGGDAGRAWSNKVKRQMEARDE
jgi:hypothetical protein